MARDGIVILNRAERAFEQRFGEGREAIVESRGYHNSLRKLNKPANKQKPGNYLA